jgi:NADH dehydrogenase
MPSRVTVFGGTGFLGRRIVRHLHDADLAARVASRHPDAVPSLFSREGSGIEAGHADVNDDGSVGAWAVVNTVSLYVERGKYTFHSVHVKAAERIAMLARQAGRRNTRAYLRNRCECGIGFSLHP